MPSIRNMLDALRAVALGLLVVSVLFGPAGLAGSVAFPAANKTCGIACPCEQADDVVQAGDGQGWHGQAGDDQAGDDQAGDDQAGAEPRTRRALGDAPPRGDDPCEDDCPDDCPNCGCCAGIAMAVLPLPMATSSALRLSARAMPPVDVLASGAASAVFRPPRSLI